MLVRDRIHADLDECARLAIVVHERDGYPPHLPGDLLGFLVAPDALAAWVAERDGRIIGHVALHRHSSPAVLAMASEALKRPADRLGVIARLLVAPEHRRGGVGRSLLDVASRHARARGRWPVLDVATHFHAAISLYESCGWFRAGQVALRFADGTALEELVYIGPGPVLG